ncbi:MAG: phosphoenolpyruvate carboxykinase (GTP), partial [Clostridia bacterium]|nr:phosphoenolpyruvate carboxykinase (GTP) [Clostridia bacterium]
GTVGETRRDPMAMLPFCGYHMADYWQHWLDMEERITNPPIICNVNWFRKNDNDEFMWPGFGDNLRVLEWILKRCEGKVDAQETAIGYLPYAEDINLEGIEDEVSLESLRSILDVDKKLWLEDAKSIEEFYAKFGDRLPPVLRKELDTLEANCAE